MSLAHGVRTVRDGLVFQYDMNNPAKSWKGEPVTNVVTLTDLDTGWSQNYNTSIQWNDYRPPVGVKSQVVSFIDENGDGSGYWYSYGDFAPQDPNTTYSISIYARTLGADWSIRAYTADNSELGRQYTNTLTCPGDGEWHRLEFNPITTPADTQSDSLSFQFTTIPAGQRCWLCAPQMTANSYHVPFVAGTRSNTQAILDISGQGNTATATSLTYNSDNTFSFNGSSDYISFDPVASKIQASDFTFEATIKGPAQDHKGIVAVNTSAGDNRALWLIRSAGMGIFDGTTWYIGNIDVDDNNWHHVAITYDLSTKNAIIYTDGVVSLNVTTGNSISILSTDKVSVGQEWDGGSTSDHFNGNISSVKIYNRALTDTEVLQNFNATRSLYGI